MSESDSWGIHVYERPIIRQDCRNQTRRHAWNEVKKLSEMLLMNFAPHDRKLKYLTFQELDSRDRDKFPLI